MGRELALHSRAARAVFEEVDAALGQKLSALMWNGPEAELTLTANAQPAIMAVSMAVVRALEADHGVSLVACAKFVAGHSLGEYSALTAAETFALADAARLLRVRGLAMQEATPVGTGAMAALLGLNYAQVREVACAAAQGEVCEAANDNAPGQVVVSGHRSAVDRAIEVAKSKGARRAMLLPVSAPFHSTLMRPAADKLKSYLDKVQLAAPKVSVVNNVDVAVESEPEKIKQALVRQAASPVRWVETIRRMVDSGVTHIVECGPGKVLAGMTKRIAPGVKSFAAADRASLEEALKC